MHGRQVDHGQQVECTKVTDPNLLQQRSEGGLSSKTLDDDHVDEDYIKEEDKEEQDQEEHVEEEDDIGVEDFDPIEDIGMPTNKRSEESSECRPSFGMPPSRGTPGASSSMERGEKRMERDPMASIMQTFSAIMADSQRKHEQ